MSKLKRFASVLLALVMCFGLTVTAFADSYDITITNSTEGYTYAAYQIFSGDYDSDSGVLSNIKWSTSNITTSIDVEGVAVSIYSALAAIEDASGANPFTDTNGDALTSATEVAAVLATYSYDDAVLQDFADVIADYITGDAAGTSTGDYDAESGNFKSTYTISGLAAGYYLVENTSVPTSDGSEGVYTRYILAQTTTVAESVSPKSSVPSIDKDLSDVDADIGDTITYYLTATLPSTYADYDSYKLVFHDTLSKGLTFDTGSVEVYVFTNGDYAYDRVLTNGTLVSESGYTVSSLTEESDGGHSFTVTLANTKTLTDSEGSTISTSSDSLIVVTFTAKLNSNAVIGGDGNPNEVYLEYSNNPNSGGSGETGTTPEDKVVTWTYELDVTKVDGADTSKILPGAKFKLYKYVDGTKYYVTVDSNNKVTGWTDNEDAANELVSDSSGIFTVIGLDVGTYYLTETEAPSGYNKLTTDITLEIAAAYDKTDSGTPTDDDVTLNTLTISVDDDATADGTTTTGVVEATVENNKGASLPSTGGIGTTIFYVVGGVLVVGAVVLLITRKRMQDNQ